MFTGVNPELAHMIGQERIETLLKEQRTWLLIGDRNQQLRFYQQILARGATWLQQQFLAQGKWPAKRLNKPTAAAGGGD
jgi:hypothetical protein